MTRFFYIIAAIIIMFPNAANAFCGFYVAKADADLFNDASKVVMARNGDRTVITMANDFRGDVKDFAIVIPVPSVITEKQVNIAESRIIDHIDAYTAPRLVEYHDDDPCAPQMIYEMRMTKSAAFGEGSSEAVDSIKKLGVTIEAEYSVGEYDIIVLSANQSDGLLTYLNQEGYKLPNGATEILGSYIKQDMKFFLARVNLDKFEKSGFVNLNPLSVAYEHEKFMLPIRLGTLNSDGSQELILFTLTQNGRVEASNYRTVKIPTGQNIPVYVENEFGEFYKSMFDRAVEKENMKAVFLEYAWDMSWCDPCAADPVPNDDLKTMGVWWLNDVDGNRKMRGQANPANVFVTRLHVRYNSDTFPEDLMLHETSDRQNFQGRYVLQQPWTGEISCKAGKDYLKTLPARFDQEAKTLVNLTGWNLADVKKKMETNGQSRIIPAIDLDNNAKPWWEGIWSK